MQAQHGDRLGIVNFQADGMVSHNDCALNPVAKLHHAADSDLAEVQFIAVADFEVDDGLKDRHLLPNQNGLLVCETLRESLSE
jgi:hypothetical protein